MLLLTRMLLLAHVDWSRNPILLVFLFRYKYSKGCLDTFELFRDSDPIPLNENGISWPANNVGVKFKQGPDSANTQWINPENGFSSRFISF